MTVVASGPRQGLIDVVRREDTEGHRHAGIAHHVEDTVGDPITHVVEVGRATADHGTETDHGVVATARRQPTGRQRKLERTRDPGDVLIVARRAAPGQLGERALEQPHADQVVEARDHEGETLAGRIRRCLVDPHPSSPVAPTVPRT